MHSPERSFPTPDSKGSLPSSHLPQTWAITLVLKEKKPQPSQIHSPHNFKASYLSVQFPGFFLELLGTLGWFDLHPPAPRKRPFWPISFREQLLSDTYLPSLLKPPHEATYLHYRDRERKSSVQSHAYSPALKKQCAKTITLNHQPCFGQEKKASKKGTLLLHLTTDAK